MGWKQCGRVRCLTWGLKSAIVIVEQRGVWTDALSGHPISMRIQDNVLVCKWTQDEILTTLDCKVNTPGWGSLDPPQVVGFFVSVVKGGDDEQADWCFVTPPLVV